MNDPIKDAELRGWQDCLSSVRGSLTEYPNGGGDIEIMKAIDDIKQAACLDALREDALREGALREGAQIAREEAEQWDDPVSYACRSVATKIERAANAPFGQSQKIC